MNAPHSYETVFFDLDGTLVDNFQAIYGSYIHMLSHFDLEPKSFDEVRKTIGGSIEVTFQRLLGITDVKEHVNMYRDHYQHHLFDGLVLLPGVLDLLKQLKQDSVKMAVFTNKKASFARMICDKVGISEYFDEVIGTVEVPFLKPEKAYSDYALDKMNTTAAKSLMVGDSPFDLGAAVAVGMDCALVATGSHDLNSLNELEGVSRGSYSSMGKLASNVFDFKAHAVSVL